MSNDPFSTPEFLPGSKALCFVARRAALVKENVKRFAPDRLSFSKISSLVFVTGAMPVSVVVLRITDCPHTFGAVVRDSDQARNLPHVTFKLHPRLQTHALPLTCSLLPPDS